MSAGLDLERGRVVNGRVCAADDDDDDEGVVLECCGLAYDVGSEV